MGRVLNYSIKKDSGSFTRKELEVMYEVSKRYNSDEMLSDINKAYKSKLKELWSCENFWLGLGGYYPNWDKVNKCKSDSESGWDFVNKRIEELEKTMSPIDAIFAAKKEGTILFHDENYKNHFHGFTKVQGNEFNSLLVFKAVLEISKRIPKATLRISDEGEFLLCPLTIKNGLVLPDVNDLIESIQFYSMKMMFSPNYKGNILGELKNTTFQNNCFKGDIHLGNTYGDMSKYIDDKLRNLQEIEKALLKVCKADNDLYLYNLQNRDSRDYFKPELFVRPVDVEKFLNYKMSAGTMMDGFSGQGFGLSDEDGEAQSYKMLANMFGMLEKAGFKKENIKTLGVD